MSNNKRRTSRTKASSKNTDLYTPDTAPIVYDDSSTVTSVELNKSETTLGVDETETLTATVLPETATDKSIT